MLSKSMYIDDPELRKIIAANQLEGAVKCLRGILTESIHVNSYGKKTNRITIEYSDST